MNILTIPNPDAFGERFRSHGARRALTAAFLAGGIALSNAACSEAQPTPPPTPEHTQTFAPTPEDITTVSTGPLCEVTREVTENGQYTFGVQISDALRENMRRIVKVRIDFPDGSATIQPKNGLDPSTARATHAPIPGHRSIGGSLDFEADPDAPSISVGRPYRTGKGQAEITNIPCLPLVTDAGSLQFQDHKFTFPALENN